MNRIDDYTLIGHAAYSLIEYVTNGTEPGGFLSAVLKGDLMAAASAADDINMWLLPVYACWLYNVPPSGCYGSPERFREWLELGGLRGKVRAGGYCEDVLEEWPERAWRSFGVKNPRGWEVAG